VFDVRVVRGGVFDPVFTIADRDVLIAVTRLLEVRCIS